MGTKVTVVDDAEDVGRVGEKRKDWSVVEAVWFP